MSCCKKCGCTVTLPQPKRPLHPVDDDRHEFLECLPCYYEATWPLEKFPFMKWLVRYDLNCLLSDIIAGLTVGLMVVPQALAYASIATLPPTYGLYSAFMGCFIYVLFGTSKDITLGPTAILSLLTASITATCDPDPNHYDKRIICALSLTFLSGAIQLALGVLNFGFLVDFIPVPVISGFTSAAAITIALGQVKHLLGISARRDVINAIEDIFRNIRYTKVWDLVLGIACIFLVVLLKLAKSGTDRYVEKRGEKNIMWPVRILLKVIWLICTARNAVVVLLAGILGFILTRQEWFDSQITLIASNHSSLPPIQFPNPTPEICKNLGIGIIAAPLISFLESIAIAKAFAKKNGYKVNPSQELVAIGMCNLASSFVGSYPVTGSFSRTAVNAQSGVRTPAAGIVTGAVVLLALGLLGSAFHYIPSASLAAIIIAAVIPVVNVPIVWKIARLKFIDVVPLACSFFLTLFLGIEYGVPLAVVLYLLFILYRHAKPRHQFVVHGNTLTVKLNGGWTYPGVNYILKRVSTEVTSIDHDPDRSRTTMVVFDCSTMPEIDYTIVQELDSTCEELHHLDISVYVIGAQLLAGSTVKWETTKPQGDTDNEIRAFSLKSQLENMSLAFLKAQVLRILEKAGIKHMKLYDTMEEIAELIIDTTDVAAGDGSVRPLRDSVLQARLVMLIAFQNINPFRKASM